MLVQFRLIFLTTKNCEKFAYSCPYFISLLKKIIRKCFPRRVTSVSSFVTTIKCVVRCIYDAYCTEDLVWCGMTVEYTRGEYRHALLTLYDCNGRTGKDAWKVPSRYSADLIQTLMRFYHGTSRSQPVKVP